MLRAGRGNVITGKVWVVFVQRWFLDVYYYFVRSKHKYLAVPVKRSSMLLEWQRDSIG